MRILHTADWHLGKRLHRSELTEDHLLFFQWLLAYIKDQKIDVVLISGDIFDTANPSNEIRKIYFEVLIKLNKLNCTVIITGGNHDSPSVLNAPKELLKALNIHVIGGMPATIEELIIPVLDKDNKEAFAVAAVPFLRDSDLRTYAKDETYEERTDLVRQGIKQLFDESATRCQQLYPTLPAIAMGHLFAHGASTSESEREIQLGNLAGFEANQFNTYFKYIALGHIHRPQQVGANENIFYSGSPIPLSFSEKTDIKRVITFEVRNHEITNVQSVEIPQQRKLIEIKGDLTSITLKLSSLVIPEEQLPALLEITMVEKDYDPSKVIALEELLSGFNHPNAIIAKHRIQFENKLNSSSELYDSNQQIADLQPLEVFKKRIENESLEQNQSELLIEAFQEILEEIQQSEH